MRLDNASFLAPIAEYSSLPFRMMCLDAGADFALVPLISVMAVNRSKTPLSHIDLSKEELGRTGIQLFGKEPADFGPAIEKIKEGFPHAAWFDLNCGCPAPNVTESGGGSALLNTPSIIEKILVEMKAHADVVSAKIRVLETWEKTLEVCKAVEKSGADFIIVHGRTPGQGYSGKADWDMIKRIKEAVSIPVVGNGDIASALQGMSLVEEGCCNGFMIARVAMSNPYVFRSEKANGFNARKAMLLDYIGRCRKLGLDDIVDIRMKALFFLRGFPESAEMRNAISRFKKTEEITGLLESY